MRVAPILLLVTGVAGCYRPTLGECKVACSGQACPSGTTCLADGFCHGDPTEALCQHPFDPDGAETPDGRPDGPLVLGDAVVTCQAADNDTPATALDVGTGGVFCRELSGTGDDHPGTCSSWASRDLFYELTLVQSQVVYYDTFGSDVPLAVTTYYGDCDDFETIIGAGCQGPVCGGAGAQRVIDASVKTCFVVEEVNPGAGGGRVVFNVIPMGKYGYRLEAGATQGILTCADSNFITSGACAGGTYGASDAGIWFTLCPGETRAPSLVVSNCENPSLIASLRRPTLEEIDCRTVIPCAVPATITFGAVTGPGPTWIFLDGPTGADCGEVDFTPTLL